MRTVDNSGSKILLVFDILCSVSNTLNLVVVGLYLYAFVCPGYGRQTYHGCRVDVICRLTGRVLGI